MYARFGVRMSKTGSQIRNNFVNAMRIVTAKKSVQIKHDITMQIHIVKFLLVISVAHFIPGYIRSCFVI